jgi:hypothetical protein
MNWRRVHLVWFTICAAIAVASAFGLMHFQRVSQFKPTVPLETAKCLWDCHTWRTYGVEE